MDTSLFFLINQGLRNPFFDSVMSFITARPYLPFVPFVLYFLISRKAPIRESLLYLSICLIAVGVSDGVGDILKTIFERPRPCQVLDGVNLLIGCGRSFSFPSNHAVNAFSLSAGLSYFFKGAGIPLYLIAGVIAFSRVYVGVHYPSDVVFGAVVGVMSFFAVCSIYNWAKENIKTQRLKSIFLLTTITLTALRLFYINTGPLELSADEAHYWEWSRRLDLSYYSKGPMIAYLIAFTTWLMGDSSFAIRFLAPIFLALSSILVYKLTKDISHNENVAVISGLLLQITPLFAAFGILMTIDSPFIFFWTLSLYLFWNSVVSTHPTRGQGSKRWEDSGLQTWLFLGIIVGLGLLTKYTMAFFYVCAFLFILFSREHRRWLKRKEPYIAFILSLIVFSPVIIWNAQHEWVTFKHTAGHVYGGGQLAKTFFGFLGSQIGVITPLLFFVVIYGAVKGFLIHRRSSSLVTRHSSLFLFFFLAPILGFFILKSLHGKVQANWAMPAYITAFVASMWYFFARERIKKGLKILLGSAFAMAVFVTVISHYPHILNLPPKMDPSSRLRGWKELGVEVGKIYNGMISQGPVFIFSDSYQVSSELAFYTPGKPETFCVNLGRRMNQYDIWGGWGELPGRNAIFVKIGDTDFPEELREAFDSYEKQGLIVRRNGRILREYSIFKCYGFRGLTMRALKGY